MPDTPQTTQDLLAQKAAIDAELRARAAAAGQEILDKFTETNVEEFITWLEAKVETAPTERLRYHMGKALLSLRQGARTVIAAAREAVTPPP